MLVVIKMENNFSPHVLFLTFILFFAFFQLFHSTCINICSLYAFLLKEGTLANCYFCRDILYPLIYVLVQCSHSFYPEKSSLLLVDLHNKFKKRVLLLFQHTKKVGIGFVKTETLLFCLASVLSQHHKIFIGGLFHRQTESFSIKTSTFCLGVGKKVKNKKVFNRN